MSPKTDGRGEQPQGGQPKTESAVPSGALIAQRKRSATATEWILRNPKRLERCTGKWVAVTEEGIVASSGDFNEVYRLAKGKGHPDPLVFKVPGKGTGYKIREAEEERL